MRGVLAVVLAAVVVPAALAVTRPHVRLVDWSPAAVSGTGFQPQERVVVVVTSSTTRLSKAVETTTRGTFVARFRKSVHVPDCGQIAVSAVGASGDRAAWKSPPPTCGAQQQPVGQ